MAEPKRDPAAGAALGALSAAKNRKVMTVVGAALIAVGIAGMIIVGSQAIKAISNQQFTIGQGESFQLVQYVFMFVLIGGLVLVIYSQVSAQRERAKQRELQDSRDNKSADVA
jgi:NO-binding membrane sensor protein with MHYT domain